MAVLMTAQSTATLLPPSLPVQPDTILLLWEAFSHAAINTQTYSCANILYCL